MVVAQFNSGRLNQPILVNFLMVNTTITKLSIIQSHLFIKEPLFKEKRKDLECYQKDQEIRCLKE